MSLNKTIVQHVVRLFAIVLLTLWSLGLSAQVSVVTQAFTGGTVVENSQSKPADDGSVIVTLTVTPEPGYSIAKSDIKVMATIPLNIKTRATEEIKIGEPLILEGDDPKELTEKRDYSVKVDAPFGIYIMEANFWIAGAVVIRPSFSKSEEKGTEQAAMFSAPSDLALIKGLRAYMVTGVDAEKGKVRLQEIEYLPKEMPVLLIADDPADSYTLPPKPTDIKELADGAKNLLRIGSATIQPKAFEDYVLHKGKFVMVDGGTLPDGKMFLDLNPNEASKTRGVLDIDIDSGTTGLMIVEAVGGTERDTGWYTIDGHRLSTPPMRTGIYIHNGKKVIIR